MSVIENRIKKIRSPKNHGHSDTPVYKIWQHMMNRCYNPNANAYEHYGGRGIKVATQWSDFLVFLADVGERPTTKHSLDRINPNGHYEPTNVRWATGREQARNMRNSVIITIEGKSQCMAAWAEENGISRNTVKQRIRLGWNREDAVCIPSGTKRKKTTKMITHEGKTQSLGDWLLEKNLTRGAYYSRIMRGCSIYEALSCRNI